MVINDVVSEVKVPVLRQQEAEAEDAFAP
jgi:hypothetical protein